MRKAGSARLILVTAAVLFAIPQLSFAYVNDAWLSGTDVQLLRGPDAIRLVGMGSLTIAIEDVNNQVNIYDFSGNVAALIFDKDTHNAESWSSYGKWVDVKDGFRWQDVGVWQTGALCVLRSKDKFAGGADISTRVLDFTRLDDRLFRRTLGIAYPKSEIAYADTTTIDMESSGTLVQGYYAHKMFNFLYIGARGWGEFEGEQRPVHLRYEVLNDCSYFGAGAAAVVTPFEWLQVGASYDLGSQLMESKSEDAFHSDVYTRRRGVPTYTTQALFSLLGKLRGVVNYKHYSYETDQTLLMNWSDRFIINPEASDIHRKLKVGQESFGSDFVATRWITQGLGIPVTFSAYFDMLNQDSWYRAEPNVLVWMDEFDQTLEEWNLGTGASYEFKGKALVGVEVLFNRGRTDDHLALSSDAEYVNFKTVDFKGGGEYLVLPWLAVRAGYSRSSEERFMGLPDQNYVANTFSAGLGCLLKGGNLTVDTAFMQKTTKPEKDPGYDLEEKYQTVMLYGRYLF